LQARNRVELTLDSCEEEEIVDDGPEKSSVSLVVVGLVVLSVDLSGNDGSDLNAEGAKRNGGNNVSFCSRRVWRRESCSRDVVEGSGDGSQSNRVGVGRVPCHEDGMGIGIRYEKASERERRRKKIESARVLWQSRSRRGSLTDLIITYRVQGPAESGRVVRAIKRMSPQLKKEGDESQLDRLVHRSLFKCAVERTHTWAIEETKVLSLSFRERKARPKHCRKGRKKRPRVRSRRDWPKGVVKHTLMIQKTEEGMTKRLVWNVENFKPEAAGREWKSSVVEA